MSEIVDFATKTPFQVDELTSSFVKLKSQGFEPTMEQMTALGDIASSKAKSFDQLSEAVIDAQTFEFERLKDFGIIAKQHGDQIQFLYNGNTTVVKKTSQAVREYILNIGRAAGVSGASAAIIKTTGGALSNLTDNIDSAYKALGDRFKPQLDASIGSLINMAFTVKSWIELKSFEQIDKESNALQILKTKLNDTNLSVEKRKDLLKELKDNYGDYLGNLNLEKSSYQQIQAAIEGTIEALGKKRQQAFYQNVMQENDAKLGAYVNLRESNYSKILQHINNYAPQLQDVQTDDASRVTMLKNVIKGMVRGGRMSKSTASGILSNGVMDDIDDFEASNKLYLSKAKEFSESANGINKRMLELGITPTSSGSKEKNETIKSNNSISTGKVPGNGIGTNSSINGSQRVNNLKIEIHNLVSGGVNIHTTTVKEGATKMADAVKEALLTAVNDANLAIQ